MKYRSARLFQNLWKSKSSNGPTQVFGGHESYCKKCIDEVCMNADLAEDLKEYVTEISRGMRHLIKLGISKKQIIKHEVAFSKVLRMGEDILEQEERCSDMFYLGLFIELKIANSWFKDSFYKLINLLVEKIKSESEVLGLRIREKIIQDLKRVDIQLYNLHFAPKNYKNSS